MVDGSRYFAEISNISERKVLRIEQLSEALEEYIDLYGSDMGQAVYEQEYLCSFTAAILGAYYGREMLAVRKEGRIDSDLEAVSGIPVHRAWDIGVRDDTSIW